MSYNGGVKKRNLLLGLVVGLVATIIPVFSQTAYAAKDCAHYGISQVSTEPSSFAAGSVDQVKVSFKTHPDDTPNGQYQLILAQARTNTEKTSWQEKTDAGETLVFTLSSRMAIDTASTIEIYLKNKNGPQCYLDKYVINDKDDYTSHQCKATISQERDGQTCYYITQNDCLETKNSSNSKINISVRGLTVNGEPYSGNVLIKINQNPGSQKDIGSTVNNGQTSFSFRADRNAAYSLQIMAVGGSGYSLGTNTVMCSKRLNAQANCTEDSCQTEEKEVDFVAGGLSRSDAEYEHQLFELCKQIPIDPETGKGEEIRQECEACLGSGEGAIWTSIGCIETTTEGIVGHLMKVGLGIAGGIALLMILAAAFLFATSEGEPKRTSEAKEILTAAIVGLLFVIFSITVLEFIGVSIFQLPQFGGS